MIFYGDIHHDKSDTVLVSIDAIGVTAVLKNSDVLLGNIAKIIEKTVEIHTGSKIKVTSTKISRNKIEIKTNHLLEIIHSLALNMGKEFTKKPQKNTKTLNKKIHLKLKKFLKK